MKLYEKIRQQRAKYLDLSRSDEALRIANRAYRMLSECNQALVRAGDEPQLLRTICQLLVGQGAYRLAWVGFAEEDEARNVRPVAQAGFEEGYLEGLQIVWADTERGRGPTGTAIRTGQPNIAQDILHNPCFEPWREQAVKRGYAASVALPLTGQGHTFGALMVYAAEPNAFAEQELKLLEELAGDLAFGIVTLRLRADRERAEKQKEPYFKFFMLSIDPMCIADPFGCFLQVNPAFTQLTGFSEHELVSKPFHEFVLPEDRQRTADEMALQVKVRPSLKFENHYWCKDGTSRLLSWTAYFDSTDGVTYATAQDITKHRQAEEALKQASAYNRSLIDVSLDPLVTIGSDGKITDVNTATETATGRSRTDLIGSDFSDYFTEPEKARTGYKQVFVEGLVRDYPLELRHRDGGVTSVLYNATIYRNDLGQVAGVFAAARDITKLKLAMKALHQREAELREAQRIGRLGSWDWDTTTDTITWSEEYYHLCGLDPKLSPPGYEEHLKIYTPESAARLDAAVKHSLQTGEGYQLVLEQVLAAGARGWIAARGEVKHNANGQITGLRGTALEITEQQLAEEKLAEKNALLSALINSTSDIVIFSLDRNYCYTEFNEKHRQEMRNIWKADIQIGSSLLESMTDPRLRALARQSIDRALGGETFTEIQLQPGPDIYFEFVWNPIRQKDGSINGVTAFIRDITARLLAARQLREQHEILSNAHEGVMIVNFANQVTLWNRGAEEIFGWAAAEVLGRPPEQFLGVGNLGVESTLRAAVERDGFWNGELQSQTRDGRKLIVDWRITLVRDEAGRPRARLAFLADITEKKLLEEKFLHAQRLENLGMLAAGIAHDLNNVLAPIMFAAPMLRASRSSESDLKTLDILEQSAGRGAALVKQILGFAHTNTGELRATQVKHLLRDIVGVIEMTFPKSIHLEQQIPADLWPVQGNATQIHQVLMNLCVNARDAMPSGGTLRVVAANRRLDSVEAGAMPGARTGDWLMLEVTDTGTGIPPDLLERIWTPFFTTKVVGKGTGLGLSTVRSIVLSHHGFVELDTKVGRGSTFRVFLPVVESESPRPKSASPFGITDGHGELILVVDDDRIIRDLISEILGQHGYRVVSCNDGVEAIALFKAHPGEIPLVVTDVDMPRLGGGALASALLQLHPDLRIVAMSGLSRNESGGSDVPEIHQLAHAFLPKPFKPEDLLGAVHQLLHPSEKP